ncbi:hypothetical protein [Rhizobium tumorigenes]|uniref:hypothetical protein n=1 Tax=Rhizobium tumorigenes TaxID=2041385 RepID=UPI00241CCF8D|nr:hypothetical protein [Rhizobium tumorigenes]WFS01506.1 hypothetical protein PR016_02375 [Rhizobium tumorigenes]
MSGRASRLLLVVSLTAALSGCSSLGLGSKDSKDPATQISVAPEGTASATPATQPVGQAYVAGKCPQIVIRDEGAIYKTYAKGAKDDASQLAYQASLVQGTRQCTTDGTALNMTIVVQGRIVAGPMGGSGSVNLPIKVSVMDGQTVLYSDTTNYQASIPAGEGAAQFLYTDNKIHVTGGAAGFVSVYVSFEQSPAAPTKTARTVRKRK